MFSLPFYFKVFYCNSIIHQYKTIITSQMGQVPLYELENCGVPKLQRCFAFHFYKFAL